MTTSILGLHREQSMTLVGIALIAPIIRLATTKALWDGKRF